MYSEKKRKKKKEKKEERLLCLTLPTWLNKADSLKEKKKEERKTFAFHTADLAYQSR